MGKAEAGSAKAVGNAMKARGLTKLRFYCQVCQKANRDEHAYRMHCESESHMRQLTLIGSNPNKAIDDFSKQFLDEFVSLLSRRFGTRRIKANQVYQEYISERHHLHMNATKWMSLSEFVKYLGREGIVHVDETEQGWFISWVDNSPAALQRQAALQKMQRQKMDDEGRQRKRLTEQIEKANEEQKKLATESTSSGAGATAAAELGLKRDEAAGPIRLQGFGSGFGSGKSDETKSDSTEAKSKPKPAFSFSTSISKSTSSSSNPLKSSSNPLKSSSNPLKSSSSISSSSTPPSSRQEPRTMAEKIRLEEQARKQQRFESDNNKRKMSGPMPSSQAQPGIKRIRM